MKGWTAKKLVRKFLEDKNQILYLETGEILMNAEDFKSIDNIPVPFCYNFLENLTQIYDGRGEELNDADLCLFCTKHIYRVQCGRCTYKKRHNWCNATESQYKTILNKVSNGYSFCDIPEMIELYEEVVDNFKRHVRNM